MTPMRRRTAALLAGALAVVLSACGTDPTPAPSVGASLPGSQPASAAPSTAPSSSPEPTPSPTPEPDLALELPETRDERVVAVTVTPTIDEAGGELLVRVVSAADTRVDDLVVRWPDELGTVLALAPFVPSEDRIRDGGDPLVQQWTKWVVGPGEHGEPAGAVSLGYGPLFPGATLDVRIFVTRLAPGPVAFDLHVLAGNDLLSQAGGEPAAFRVEIP